MREETTNTRPLPIVDSGMVINSPPYQDYPFVLSIRGQDRGCRRHCFMLTSHLGLSSMLSKIAVHRLYSKKPQTPLLVVRDNQPGVSGHSMQHPAVLRTPGT